YLARYGLDPGQRRPDDAHWTGAEIKACCRLAALLDLPLVQAAQARGPGGGHLGRVDRPPADLGQRPVPLG
ncbi:MAG: hypothetical protein KDA75_21680, partial [Planctomycetaceae bacterium]|nr:hypothetical protein [Planctomycetaceae bacterium]